MNITLQWPTDSKEEAFDNVTDFETEFGSENTVTLEVQNRETPIKRTGTGLTVVSGSTNSE